MKSKSVIIVLLFVAFHLTGCVSSKSANVYSRNTAMKAQTVEKGTVESVRQVKIEGTKTPIGTTVGAVTGGVLGSTIGGGSGKTIATVIGALAGAAAGTVAEEGLTQNQGFEIVVKKDNGQTIVIVQEADVLVSAGDRVNIIRANDGTARVAPIRI